MDHQVTLQRTEVREVVLTVSAMDKADAEQMAREQADDIDFYDYPVIETRLEVPYNEECVTCHHCDKVIEPDTAHPFKVISPDTARISKVLIGDCCWNAKIFHP